MKDNNKEYCRFCHHELKHTFVNLGMSPLSNSYIPMYDSDKGQMSYPLHAKVCEQCWLVQLGEFESPQDIFSDYAYFSSYSSSWLEHAKKYVDHMVDDFSIDQSSQVIEIASNDGYLLQYFKGKGIPVLGIEPAKNVAAVAQEKGIPVITDFFGTALAEKICAEGRKANLLLGNNVLAHVPDINDFVEGMKIILADDGFITLEFPHLLNLIQQRQFDTIYHEHFSYISLLAAQKFFSAHGLRVFDVEELPTHGGSLRLFICHDNSAVYNESLRVAAVLNKEIDAGMNRLETYTCFQKQVCKIKYDLLSCLIDLKRSGKKIVGYGAAAKGNTLLNYCGIGTEFIDFVVDKNPHKQDTLLPGSRIPVFAPEEIQAIKPDYILILPWNLKDEIMEQLSFVRQWGAKFIVVIPNVEVL